LEEAILVWRENILERELFKNGVTAIIISLLRNAYSEN